MTKLNTQPACTHTQDSAVSAAPSVSVVIPCRNEIRAIASCLDSVLAQEPVPGGFEVIVVDGMSDDGTRDVLRSFAGRSSLTILDNPERITPCALNIGIRVARGQFIARMDAHHRYAPDYLRLCYETAMQTGADNIGGGMIAEGMGYVGRAIAAAHHSPFAVGGARWHNPRFEGPADTVYGGFFRRDVFNRVGMFDEFLVRNQDDEFNLRIVRAGGTIWQSPRIKSWYRPRGSLAALFRQYMQYGYWKVWVIAKHKVPMSVRHIVPGSFVLILLALALAAPFLHPASWALLILLGTYALGISVASLLTARRAGRDLLPVLPAVFWCYHFGYGYGFVHGLWDCWIRRKRPGSAFTAITRESTKAVAPIRAIGHE